MSHKPNFIVPASILLWLAHISGAPLASTTATLTLSPSPSTFGQIVTLTAVVSPSTATGLVTFYDGATVLGEAALASGRAVLNTIGLAAGTQALRAYYGGDARYAPSTSSSVTQTVNTIASATFFPTGPLAIASNACGGQVAPSPLAIAVGDFNEDGKADLAVGLERTDFPSAGCVIVLLGNGSGSFVPAPGNPTPVGLIPVSLVVADFNGDGKQDLAVGNNDNPFDPQALVGGGVVVLLGDGNGGFSAVPGTSPARGTSAYSLVAADLNGDGKTDLAGLFAYQNDEAPESHPPPPPPATYSGLIGLGDGLGDLSFGSSFGPMQGMLVDGICMAVGDFNGDGRADLAVVVNAYNSLPPSPTPSLWIELGDGTGGFTASPASPFPLTSLPGTLAVGDFNGDGKADVAVISSTSVTMLLGDGRGGFTMGEGSQFDAVSGPVSATALDFNGDSKTDVAFANSGNNNVVVWLGDGSGGFTGVKTFSVGTGPAGLAAADFNGDGRVDLAAANSGTGNVSVLLGASGASPERSR